MALRVAVFFLLSLVLLGLIVFGIFIARDFGQTKTAATAPAASQQILVAAAALHAGSLMQPGDIAAMSVPVGQIPAGASLDSPADRTALIGAMIRRPLEQNAPILASEVIRPGDHGFLAAVLQPGMRAVTVGVDAVSGSAGLIWPGDHVDVLLTQTLTDDNVPLGQRIAAELVLEDVRVIATGQQLVQGAVSEAGKQVAEARTVTLEVTPNAAERVAVATHLGPLSLVVHSSEHLPDSMRVTKPTAPVWADQVSPALSNVQAGPSVVTTVRVFQGATDGTDFKF
ncbi:MAG: Flp pilus assembly protein CpaB [Rhodospirillales bacterium 20-60-12]|jgi:pilus assembly protein CpaB|nr:MAG: Flp pilus assembly protein CpaB [Rhodospirillales bacterium 20-60-12]HQT68653.1 Flp pilus assembly protein CpaB [Acetobacteraceae bacterium]HQU01305.1 Flp pilus assembly protein CpaB [Acetobacteraceae bacterium]